MHQHKICRYCCRIKKNNYLCINNVRGGTLYGKYNARVQVIWFPPQPFESPGRFFDMDLQRKIDFAIKLLRSIPQDGPIELSYSGGKDSDVILELAKMAGIPFEMKISGGLFPELRIDAKQCLEQYFGIEL